MERTQREAGEKKDKALEEGQLEQNILTYVYENDLVMPVSLCTKLLKKSALSPLTPAKPQ